MNSVNFCAEPHVICQSPIRVLPALSESAFLSMSFLNDICSRYPSAISFAPGRPLETAYDTDLITSYVNTYVKYLATEPGTTKGEIARTLFQYGSSSGIIQEIIASYLEVDENIVLAPNDIVVTVGAQEAMLIVLRTLCAEPGDAILVSEPCYVGIVCAAKILNIPVIPVNESESGLTAQGVQSAYEGAVKQGLRPVLLHLTPSYANPSGKSLNPVQKKDLLRCAKLHNFYIIEDSPYSSFSLEVDPLPSLKSIDYDGRVIYVGSFSKTCFPGARIGFIAAEQGADQFRGGTKLAQAFATLKNAITINTSAISQAVIGGLLLQCQYSLKKRNIPTLLQYRKNLRTLLSALESAFSGTNGELGKVSWNHPTGGFFVVVDVPFETNEEALERCASQFGVLWVPMRYFYSGKGGERALRLSISSLNEEEIYQGILKFREFIEGEILRKGLTS